MEKTRKEVHIIMKIIDFSKCELSNRNLEYTGRAGEKNSNHKDIRYSQPK